MMAPAVEFILTIFIEKNLINDFYDVLEAKNQAEMHQNSSINCICSK